jgi:ketosteroid isomerase-like protein
VSAENVQALRDHFSATNAGDFEGAMSYYADDVELFVDPDAFLDGGTFKGRDAVGRWFGQWFATFAPGYTFEISETRDLGDVVLLVATHHGRGRSSGAEVNRETGYLYSFRGGKIVKVELYRDREAALEAAGLNE